MTFDIQVLLDQQEAIAQGIGQTLLISSISALLSLVLGLVLLSLLQGPLGILRWLCRAYVEFFRNTPLLIHLYLLYKGLPYVGLTLDPVLCGIVGLSLQSAAYMAEIYRAGIEAVPKQQTESGLAIGLSRTEVLFGITMPQALRLILPPLGNQIVSVFKNSSLVAFITVPDIFFVVYEQSVTYFHYLEYFALGLVIYMTLTLLTTAAMAVAERCLPWAFVQLEWALLTIPPVLDHLTAQVHTRLHPVTAMVFHTGRLPTQLNLPRYGAGLNDQGMSSPLTGLTCVPSAEALEDLQEVSQHVDAICSTAASMQSPFNPGANSPASGEGPA